MSAGRVLFWTLVGGGSVALTAFALKYYLKRKSSGCSSVGSSVAQPQTDGTFKASEVKAEEIVVGNAVKSAAEKMEVAAEAAADDSGAAPPEAAAEAVPKAAAEAVPEAVPEAAAEAVPEAAAEVVPEAALEAAAEPWTPQTPRSGSESETPIEVEEVAVAPAKEASSVTAAPQIVDIVVNKPSTRPTVIIASAERKPETDLDDGDDEVEGEFPVADSTPPMSSFGYLLGASARRSSDFGKPTPPTPPSTPAPPSRGDEDGVGAPIFSPSMDLMQAAIQGRLATVKPRFHSTDSTTTDDRDEEEAVDVGISPDSEEGDLGEEEAATDAASMGKLHPICEEGAGLTTATFVEATPLDAATEATETKPLSPYVRRKKRGVQAGMDGDQSQSSSHETSTGSKDDEDAAAVAAASAATTTSITEAATASGSPAPPPPPPQRTPRPRRRSDQHITGDINISADDNSAAAADSETKVDGGSSSGSSLSADGCGGGSIGESGNTGGDESPGSIDYSFMSDADDVMKEFASMTTTASATSAKEADLLDGIEDVTLDDVLRDISSMSGSTPPMTASMVVQVDGSRSDLDSGGGAKDDDDDEEDLVKRLDLAEELVLDDKFYGGTNSSSSAAPKVIDDDDLTLASMMPEPAFKKYEKYDDDGDDFELPSLENEPTKPTTEGKDGEDSYDMHIGIGFTDKSGFDDDEERGFAAGQVAGAAVEAGAAANDSADDAADAKADIKATTKASKKRVVRPRPKRPSFEGSGKGSASTASAAASKDAASKSPTATTTKTPPSKTPRGSGKRTGIPKPGYQPFQP